MCLVREFSVGVCAQVRMCFFSGFRRVALDIFQNLQSSPDGNDPKSHRVSPPPSCTLGFAATSRVCCASGASVGMDAQSTKLSSS